MSEQVTFIHAADLHLGAPFKGLRGLPDRWARRMVDAIPQAFERLIQAALDHHVDFVVIAGDLFDLACPSYGEYALFLRGMQRLDDAGIPVYFCTGNHDPYSAWQQEYGALPDNMHRFPAGDDAGFFVYEREGKPLVLLAGRGYYHRIWPHDRDIADGLTRQAAQQELGVDAPFAVGVLHTGLDIDPVKAPTSPAKLRASGMDYWALGHIHSRYVDDPENPRIAFSGCIQGRASKNTGARGVNLITLTAGEPNRLEFIPTASVVWERFGLDISECETLMDVSRAVLDELYRLNGEASCDAMIERITLTGTTRLHSLLRRPGVLEDLRGQVNAAYDSFYCDALVDETRLPYDRDELLRQGLFPAVFLRTSSEHAANRPDEVSYLQQEFIDRNIGVANVDASALDRLDREAELLVLDMLGEGREGA